MTPSRAEQKDKWSTSTKSSTSTGPGTNTPAARPRDWSRAFTVDGKPYWFDVDTDETTWVRPDGYLTEEDRDDSEDEAPQQSAEAQVASTPATATSRGGGDDDDNNGRPTTDATTTSKTSGVVPNDAAAPSSRKEAPRASETESNDVHAQSHSARLQVAEPTRTASEVGHAAAVAEGASESKDSVQEEAVAAQPSEAQAPKKRFWSRTFAADGRPYWFDVETDETTWDRPDGYLTEEDRDSDGDGSGANSPDANAGKATLEDDQSAAQHADNAAAQPASAELTAIDSANHSSEANATKKQKWARALAPDGRPYWFDVDTDETTWERPDGYRTEDEEHGDEASASGADAAAAVAAAAAEEPNKARAAEVETVSLATESPASANGAVQPTHDSATKPKETARVWSRTFAEDGRPYWFDVDTDETTWDRPAEYHTDDDDDVGDGDDDDRGPEDEEQGNSNAPKPEVEKTGEQVIEAAPGAVSTAVSVWSSATDDTGQRYYFNKEVRCAASTHERCACVCLRLTVSSDAWLRLCSAGDLPLLFVSCVVVCGDNPGQSCPFRRLKPRGIVRTDTRRRLTRKVLDTRRSTDSQPERGFVAVVSDTR